MKGFATVKKLYSSVGTIIASRVLGVITIAALFLVAGGIAMKADVPTAMIVTGAILLADLTLDGFLRRGPA